jgi:hypothetical protein
MFLLTESSVYGQVINEEPLNDYTNTISTTLLINYFFWYNKKPFDHRLSCLKKLGSEWTFINLHSVTTHFGWWCKVKSPSLHSALGRGIPTQRHANFTETFHGTVTSWPNDTIDAGTIKRKINKNYIEYNFLTTNLELTYSNLLFPETRVPQR